MFQKPTTLEDFFSLLQSIMSSELFVQCSLGKPAKHSDLDSGALKRVLLRPVSVKEGDRILIVTSEARRDLTRTVSVDEAIACVRELLGTQMLSATVKTTERDLFIEISKSGTLQVGTGKASVSTPPTRSHDRQKQFTLSTDLPWLCDLGITNATGALRMDMRDKFIQIERFVNLLRPELDKLPGNLKHISALDVGSGKSYLTFALYQLLSSTFPNAEIAVRGIEKRSDLVQSSNSIAAKHAMHGLRFMHGLADELTKEALENRDNAASIVVALHACDTATDDALKIAINNHANLICVAPCCHKYVRKKMKPSGTLETLSTHGIHAERLAETITDALRGLYLESQGYATKVVEFIDKSHTAKNTMILATLAGLSAERIANAKKEMAQLKLDAGLNDFFLDV